MCPSPTVSGQEGLARRSRIALSCAVEVVRVLAVAIHFFVSFLLLLPLLARLEYNWGNAVFASCLAHDGSWARRGWDDGSLRLPDFILTLLPLLYSNVVVCATFCRCHTLCVRVDTFVLSVFCSYGGSHGSTLHGDDRPERAIVPWLPDGEVLLPF